MADDNSESDESFVPAAYDGILAKDIHGTPTSKDIVIAVITLLLSAAYSDDSYTQDEFQQVVSSSAAHFQFTEAQVGECLEVAQYLLSNTPQDKILHKESTFFKRINLHFTTHQKQILLAMVWRIIGANKQVTTEEIEVAQLLRKALLLTLEEAAWAREIGEDELTESFTQLSLKAQKSSEQ